MSGSKWRDQDIEELLKKMPPIKNTQSPTEMYTRIQRASASNAKRTQRILPIAAGIAAIFLLAILIPSFLINNESVNISSSDDAGEIETVEHSDGGNEESKLFGSEGNESEGNSADSQATDTEEENSGKIEEGASQNITSQDGEVDRKSEPQNESKQDHPKMEPASRQIALNEEQGTSLYPSELEGNAYFSAAFITPEQDIIPMTFILPEENTGQSMVDLYNEWAGTIDETSLGFIDYHPFNDGIEETEDIITGWVNDSDQYKDASADIMAEFLRQTFGNDGYREFQLLNRDGSKALNGEEEAIQLANDRKGYFLYENEGNSFFVESLKSYGSLNEALKMMQTSKPNERFSYALPPELELTAVENENELTITSDGTINQYSDSEQQQIIEAILLTAKSFSYQTVQFQNEPSETGGFDLSKPVEVPIGPNQATIE
ncbi:hypothetical protein E2R51_03005 [Jeotgalibacillus sp. S-D1]|uniref:hypothetical protein n=1 Tax=Jeotgalibacillus sp. S-D1 TaxID=2552189 RepID=UPI0010593AC0|nr:hypothetical protein [Jeotgalibacillus sp. S-D1]TDL34703.1 hypothetical protein E2R51_03005 [Jeotgalibacillus sp. S-D1]